MKFGLTLWLDRNPGETADAAALAEKEGFDFMWIPDHYFLRDGFMTLALIADRTESIRMGAGVASPLLRHPSLLASAAATLDEISEGRAVHGIGLGGHEFESHLCQDVSRPLRVVREAAEILEALGRDGPVSYDGERFPLRGAALPADLRRTIPIYLAARGPGMLKLAGRVASGMITHGTRRGYLEFALAQVQEGRKSGGAGNGAFDLAVQARIAISSSKAKAVDQMRSGCVIMAGGAYADELIPLYGLSREEVHSLRKAIHETGYRDEAAVAAVTDNMVEAFCIVGTAGECRESICEMESFGVTQVIVGPGPGKGPSEVEGFIRTFSKEIIRSFR